MRFKKIRKRDGRIEEFNAEKITNAIAKAGEATGEFGRDVAKKLTLKVLSLAEEVIKSDIPTVEEIQDIVEEVLLTSPYKKTAKAYIIYRDQHAKIREIVEKADVSLVDQYLQKLDWQVRENSNMTFSLQGLNNYISSQISKIYWLNKIYPPEVKKAHIEGDFHIHDLNLLAIYCVGWDLYDLLLRGFGGVPGKIESKPARHLRSALGQVVNFFYTLQGEAAGAQAFSNFDTLLAPFIRYDGLSEREVEQALQEFVFNVNVPTRVGFQCLSEDTKILTPEGWKGYDEIEEGDVIYTFNIRTGEIEKKKVTFVFRRYYEGLMYNLKNRSQDQLISPGHRVVRKKFGSDEYVLQPIEDLLNFTPIAVPTCAENSNEDIPLSDEQIKLIAWILSEGSMEKSGSYRVSIYQSRFAQHFKEIVEILDVLNLECAHREQFGLGVCNHLRLLPSSSKLIHSWLSARKKTIPAFLFSLSQRQARIFVETYAKGDGWKEKGRLRIVTTSEEMAEALAAIAVLAGYNCNIKKRVPKSEISKKIQYVLTLTKTACDYIQKIERVYYKGIIWSVHTENETVIAMRNGQVFITGNTPFTNITLDVDVPSTFEDMPVIIGGEPQNETYKDFQDEIDMFNKAFLKVLLEGDAKSRVFTFPIPTYNITKDFRWDDECIELLWDVTAKYGVPYFSNFINSDMRPEDARSMCCRLRLELDKLERRGGGLFGASPMTGSIGVVTINMPRLGYLSKDESEFFERLQHLMQLASRSLEIKRKVLERFTEHDLYPYSKHYLKSVKERFGEYWKNHFSTIGLVGMNECCLNFLGENIASPEGRKFTIKTLDFMRSLLVEFQEETSNLYNLEATPAEGCSYRLALIDKEKYPDIICANEEEYRRGAEPFYTNSTQLPVNYTDDVFEALELQEEIQTKYTGGTVFHVYIGEEIKDSEVVKRLVRKICENFRIPYFTITPTFSVCPSHGYIAGKHEKCPKCGRECEVYSRVVGYLRPVSQWNAGKQEEFKMRKTFRI